MSANSVWISCGAALSCDADSGVSVKQHGHLTSLELTPFTMEHHITCNQSQRVLQSVWPFLGEG